MNDYFSKDIRESVRELKTDLLQGLSGQEAQKRLEENGHNRLQGAAERTLFQLFAEQFKDFLVIILIVAAVITPTADVLTMVVVAFPLFILYEVSIFISASIERKRNKELYGVARVKNP